MVINKKSRDGTTELDSESEVCLSPPLLLILRAADADERLDGSPLAAIGSGPFMIGRKADAERTVPALADIA